MQMQEKMINFPFLAFALAFCVCICVGVVHTSRENEGPEREAPGPEVGICHVYESYF